MALHIKNPAVVLVGVPTYQNNQYHSLNSAWANVKSLQQILINDLGYDEKNIIVCHGDTILERRQFAKELKKLDNLDFDGVIFYYSGHGIVENGRYYLALASTEPDNIIDTAIDVQDYYKRLLKHAAGRPVIVILDSCFSERGITIDTETKVEKQLFLVSSRRNATSEYPLDSEHSLFTKYLIETIKEFIASKQSSLPIIDLINNLRNKVNEENKNTTIKCPDPIPLLYDLDDCSLAVRTDPFDRDSVAFEIIRSLEKVNGSKCRTLLANYRDDPDETIKNLLDLYPTPVSYVLKKILNQRNAISLSHCRSYYLNIVKFISFLLAADISNNDLSQIPNQLKLQLKKLQKPGEMEYYELYLELADYFSKQRPNVLDVRDYSPVNASIESLHNLYNSNQSTLPEMRLGLIALIKSLNFLTQYRLIAVRAINVQRNYKVPKYYLHQYSLLANEHPLKYIDGLKLESPLYSSTVILANIQDIDNFSEHTKYLNLWPFIIDKNSFFEMNKIQNESTEEEALPDKNSARSKFGKNAQPIIYIYKHLKDRKIFFDDMREGNTSQHYRDIHQDLLDSEYEQNLNFFTKNILFFDI